MLIFIIFFIATFLFMEGVAWFTHKYVMHGFLWNWHEDHHSHKPGFFEKNDLFFLIFALPSMVLIMVGAYVESTILSAIGFGIAGYGLCYFLVHDVYIHQRFKWMRKIKHPYFIAIRKAHYVHHKTKGKEGSSCFGMLWVPLSFFRSKKKNIQRA